MTDTHSPDPATIVARYAPSTSSLAADWNPEHMDEVLGTIVAVGPASADATQRADHHIEVRFIPTHAVGGHRRWSRALPVAASVAALAVGAGVLIATVGSGGSDNGAAAGGTPTLGVPFTPPAGLSDTSIQPGQYSYRVDQQIDLDADGNAIPGGQDAMLDRNYVAYNGDITSIRTGSQLGCIPFRRDADASFEQPDVAFFAGLPTGVDALNTYLRSHVQGSSSHDEAVFVAVGDALRSGDGLASPKLRGAMLAVLSRTPGVRLHLDDEDYLGRPAIRADFVDQAIRPGEVHAYYFDPATFQLLEEFDGSNSAPSSYAGPSPAYSAHAAEDGVDPDRIDGPGYVDIMKSETVLDSLPESATHCSGYRVVR